MQAIGTARWVGVSQSRTPMSVLLSTRRFVDIASDKGLGTWQSDMRLIGKVNSRGVYGVF